MEPDWTDVTMRPVVARSYLRGEPVENERRRI